jgi:hypothetical protein
MKCETCNAVAVWRVNSHLMCLFCAKAKAFRILVAGGTVTITKLRASVIAGPKCNRVTATRDSSQPLPHRLHGNP